MFIFIRLLLAHCLGDFPFQTNAVFKLKTQGLYGVALHALIVTGCCLLLSWPYLHIPQMWFFILFIGVMHFVQDSIKISYKNPKYHATAYVLDQVLHISLIAIVLLTDLKNLVPPPDQGNFLISLYSNDRLMILMIALVFATYNGFFLLQSLGKLPALVTTQDQWFGFAERAAIVSCFLLPGFWVVPGLMVIFLIRGLALSRTKSPGHGVFRPETISSWAIGLGCGIPLLFLL